VNGRTVGRGNNFHQVGTFDVTAWMKHGDNRIDIEAGNGGNGPNPAGLIAALEVCFADGRTVRVTTDRQWGSALTKESETTPAMELGGFGMAPWNLRPPEPPPPELYPGYRVTAKTLAESGVPPDFESDGSVRYIHRAVGGSDVYFIANREDTARDVTCRFRVTGKRPEWWDPLDGTCRALPEFETEGGVTSVPLRLDALESGFVVFRKEAADGARASSRNRRTFRAAAGIEGPWQVAFDAKRGGPGEAVAFETLQDWAKREEDGIRHYSGVAVYRTAFDAPQGCLGREDVFLSLGEVKVMAGVTLNGRGLGAVWCAPWRVRVPAGLLRGRGNALEVRVANLWCNRLIGDAGLPEERRFTKTTRNPYRPDSPLQPSGLLGPVTLLTAVDE
jgi:hypothetical protein